MSITITNISVTDGSRFSGYDATVPGQPLNVSAVTNAGGQATVSFSPPISDGGTNILYYTIVSTPNGLTEVGGASPITINGLDNGGTSYTFKVYATSIIGNGPLSDPSNSVTPILVSSQVQFTTVGTTNWTVPAGVTSISIVAVGGGGGPGGDETYYPSVLPTQNATTIYGGGGGGGGLAYTNNISVTPGQVLTVNVGNRGNSGSPGNWGYYSNGQPITTSYATKGFDGGSSNVISNGDTVVEAGGGIGGDPGGLYYSGVGGAGGGVNTGDGGGSGGSGGTGGTAATGDGYMSSDGGGGGAGGYAGNGGDGAYSSSSLTTAQSGANAAVGSGGGGGGMGGYNYTTSSGGGGVGLLGLGSDGRGGYKSGSFHYAGYGGSGGTQGTAPVVRSGYSNFGVGSNGQYGGGCAGSTSDSTRSQGAVRIIWGNSSYTRAFPSTNTGNV